MNTYIKTTNGATNDYFYAFVEFKETMLELSSPQGLNKTVMKKIPLDEISGLAKDTYFWEEKFI